MMTTTQEDREKWFGIFHSLAEMDRDQLEESFTEDNVHAVSDLVAHFLVGCELPSDLTAAPFADFVYELRENERAWSRQLGETIIAAEDKLQANDMAGAVAILDDYITLCPWAPYRETAETEKENFKP